MGGHGALSLLLSVPTTGLGPKGLVGGGAARLRLGQVAGLVNASCIRPAAL